MENRRSDIDRRQGERRCQVWPLPWFPERRQSNRRVEDRREPSCTTTDMIAEFSTNPPNDNVVFI